MPNNILNAYKALQMSYKSYFYQKEPLNKKPLNQSKLAKMEKPKKTEKKPKKTEKKPKKTSPKFEICGSVRFFLGCNPPCITVVLKVSKNVQTIAFFLFFRVFLNRLKLLLLSNFITTLKRQVDEHSANLEATQ